jgi:hypothetical protein
MISKVYRLEIPKTQEGFYLSLAATTLKMPPRPTGQAEGWGEHDIGMYYGCRSKKQFRAYFPKRIREGANKMGLVCSVYHIDKKKVTFGAHQVIFPIKEATLLQQVNPAQI